MTTSVGALRRVRWRAVVAAAVVALVLGSVLGAATSVVVVAAGANPVTGGAVIGLVAVLGALVGGAVGARSAARAGADVAVLHGVAGVTVAALLLLVADRGRTSALAAAGWTLLWVVAAVPGALWAERRA